MREIGRNARGHFRCRGFALAVSALLLSLPAHAQLPGTAATVNQLNTMPQQVQTILIDARQTFREARIDPCDRAKTDAAIAHLQQLLAMVTSELKGGNDLKNAMHTNLENILRQLGSLIPGQSFEEATGDMVKDIATDKIKDMVKEGANFLLEDSGGSLGPGMVVVGVIGKFDKLNAAMKLEAQKEAILQSAELQAANLGAADIIIDGSQTAQAEIQSELAQLQALGANCGERTATGFGIGVTANGSTTGVTVTPGADVAKNHIMIVDQTTQHNIPGGHIVVIPDNPAQPVKETTINPTGTTEIPRHGPNDVVEIVGTCHQKIDLKGSAVDGASGLNVSLPSKPVEVAIAGVKCSEVDDKVVNDSLQQETGATLIPGKGAWTAREKNMGGLPVCIVTVNTFKPPQPANATTGGAAPAQCPSTTTGGGGGTVTTGGGPATGTCSGGGCTIVDGGGSCTVDNGCTFTEGNIPQEIQGPPPSDPLAQSKGSWGQSYYDQWWLRAIDWLKPDGTTVLPPTGTPVIVAVIDTGLDIGHPDLAGALWVNPQRKAGNTAPDADGIEGDLFGYNFVDKNGNILDRNGHGTVVAGIIAARSSKGFGIAGIDPWATIMPLKAMEIDGQGGSINVSRAVTYAADHGARIINLSVGGKRLSRLEQLAFDYAAKKGVLIVVASGNEGVDTANWSPAGLRHALTVAAVDPDLKRPTFSNWGANVALAAPGVDILSLRARQTDLLMFARNDYKPGTAVVKGSYYRVTGSSFAAPMVAGAAALLLSVRPELTAVQVTRILEQTARNLSGIGTDQFTGYGLIDVDAALKADPNRFVEAAISDVGVAQADGRTVVRVSGTASADQLKEAYIEIGVGDAPTSWKRVSRTISAPVVGGVLDDLDPSVFAGSKDWTLRVVAVDQDGKQREARYKLSLG